MQAVTSEPVAQESASHPKYRADIDGLRAIAVLAVVGFHAFPTHVKGGFTGVDVFFVISGFLISTIIMGGLEKNKFSFLEFYSRRIKRIFPALLAILITCLALGWLVLLADEYRQLGKHIAGGAGFIANFIIWDESGYFDNTAVGKPMLHLWSLGIEEQYYILWPVLLWLAWKFSTKKILRPLLLTIILGLLSFGLNIIQIDNDAIATFFSPQTRFWELLIGSALAYVALFKKDLLQRLQVSTVFTSHWQSLLGAALIGLGILLIRKDSLFPGWWALLPTAGTALIIAAGSGAWLNRVVLSTPLLVWFGLISYPLYLWHWPLLSFLRIIEGTHHEAAIEKRVAVVLLSVVLSWLTYRFIEKPVRFENRVRPRVLLGLMLVVGVLGYACYQKDGFPSRVNIQPASAHVLFEEYPHPLRNEQCSKIYPEFKKAWTCLLSKPQKAEVAIIGDSHAHQYYRSLAKKLKNKSVLNISHVGCMPFSSRNFSEKPKCVAEMKQTLDFLRRQDSIKTVYLAGYFSYLSAGGFKNGDVEGLREARTLTKSEALSFQKNGIEVLSALAAAQKDVVVMRDVPDVIFEPKNCVRFDNAIMTRLRSHITTTHPEEKPCAIDRVDYEKRAAPYDAVLSELLAQFPKVRVFDPRSLFCERNYCWVIRDDIPLYWNSHHLTVEGSNMVIEALLKKTPPLQ